MFMPVAVNDLPEGWGRCMTHDRLLPFIFSATVAFIILSKSTKLLASMHEMRMKAISRH